MDNLNLEKYVPKFTFKVFLDIEPDYNRQVKNIIDYLNNLGLSTVMFINSQYTQTSSVYNI